MPADVIEARWQALAAREVEHRLDMERRRAEHEARLASRGRAMGLSLAAFSPVAAGASIAAGGPAPGLMAWAAFGILTGLAFWRAYRVRRR